MEQLDSAAEYLLDRWPAGAIRASHGENMVPMIGSATGKREESPGARHSLDSPSLSQNDQRAATAWFGTAALGPNSTETWPEHRHTREVPSRASPVAQGAGGAPLIAGPFSSQS